MSASATEHTDPVHIHKHHVSSVPFLLTILAILLVLTALTVFTATQVDLGGFNLVLAMIIASVKAGLVIAFFMHLAHDKPFNAVLVFYTILTVATFFVFTIVDLSSRGMIDPVRDVTLVEPPMAADAIAKSEEEHGEGHDDEHADEGDAESH
ncbi:MAG: cytochrome C oxidase subunit IV family protein [Phycisphaerales bacterium JB043]